MPSDTDAPDEGGLQGLDLAAAGTEEPGADHGEGDLLLLGDVGGAAHYP